MLSLSSDAYRNHVPSQQTAPQYDDEYVHSRQAYPLDPTTVNANRVSVPSRDSNKHVFQMYTLFRVFFTICLIYSSCSIRPLLRCRWMNFR